MRVPEPYAFRNVALSTSYPPPVDMWITRWTPSPERRAEGACFRTCHNPPAPISSPIHRYPPLSTDSDELSTKLSTEICTGLFGLASGGTVGWASWEPTYQLWHAGTHRTPPPTSWHEPHCSRENMGRPSATARAKRSLRSVESARMPCLPRLFASRSHVSLTPVYNQSQCGIT